MPAPISQKMRRWNDETGRRSRRPPAFTMVMRSSPQGDLLPSPGLGRVRGMLVELAGRRHPRASRASVTHLPLIPRDELRREAPQSLDVDAAGARDIAHG